MSRGHTRVCIVDRRHKQFPGAPQLEQIVLEGTDLAGSSPVDNSFAL